MRSCPAGNRCTPRPAGRERDPWAHPAIGTSPGPVGIRPRRSARVAQRRAVHRRLYRRSLLVLDRRPAGTPQEIFAAPTRHLEIARALVEPAGAAQPASPSMWALIQSYTQIQAELVAT